MAIISMVLRRFEVVFTAGTVASGTGTKRVRGHEDIARLPYTALALVAVYPVDISFPETFEDVLPLSLSLAEST